MLYAIIGVLVIIADQWIKFWVAGHIPLTSAGETLIPGVLSLANVHNEGAAFGFLSGSGARIPFIILAGVFALVVIIALATNLISGRLARWSIVLVTAGGLSNCIDRVIYGYVQDMFKLELFDFPVFNLADVFITVFAIVFALAILFGKTRREEEDEDDEEEEDEEPRVSRRKQKKQKRSRRRDRDEDEYDEEEDEEEEEPAPVRKPSRAARKAAKRAAKEVEEETPPARKSGKKASKSAETEEPEEVDLPAPRKAASRAPAKAAPEEDPFAAWDRANAKTAKPRATQPKAAAAPAEKPAQPVRASQPAAKPQPPQRPTPPAQPAPVPAAPKPTPKPEVEEEFSLEDILNEFR